MGDSIVKTGKYKISFSTTMDLVVIKDIHTKKTVLASSLERIIETCQKANAEELGIEWKGGSKCQERT